MKLTKQILNKLILEEIDEAESVDSIYNKEAETLEDTGDSEESDDAQRKSVGDLLNHEDETHVLQGFDLADMLFPEEVEKAKEVAKDILKWSLQHAVEVDNKIIAEQAALLPYNSYKSVYSKWKKKLKPIYDLIENFDGSQEAFDNILDTQHQMYLDWTAKRTFLPQWYDAPTQSIRGERKLPIWPDEILGGLSAEQGKGVVWPDEFDLFEKIPNDQRPRGYDWAYKSDIVEQTAIRLLKKSFS